MPSGGIHFDFECRKDGQNDRARFTDPPTAGTMAKPNRTEQNRIQKFKPQTASTSIDPAMICRAEQSRTHRADLDLVTLMTKQSTTSKNISVPPRHKKQLVLTSDHQRSAISDHRQVPSQPAMHGNCLGHGEFARSYSESSRVESSVIPTGLAKCFARHS